MHFAENATGAFLGRVAFPLPLRHQALGQTGGSWRGWAPLQGLHRAHARHLETPPLQEHDQGGNLDFFIF